MGLFLPLNYLQWAKISLISTYLFSIWSKAATTSKWNFPVLSNVSFKEERENDQRIFASSSGACQDVEVKFEITDFSNKYDLWWVHPNGSKVFSGVIGKEKGEVHQSCTGHSFLVSHSGSPTASSWWFKAGSDKVQLMQVGPSGACFSASSTDGYSSVKSGAGGNTFVGSLLPVLQRLNGSAEERNEEERTSKEGCLCSRACFVKNDLPLPELQTLYDNGDSLLIDALEIFIQECSEPAFQRSAHGMLGHTLLHRADVTLASLDRVLDHLWRAFSLGDASSQSTLALLLGILGEQYLLTALQRRSGESLPETATELADLLRVSLGCAASAGDASARAAMGFRFLHGLDSEEKNCNQAAEFYNQAANQALTGEPLTRTIYQVEHADPEQRWKPIEIADNEKVLLMDLAAKGDAMSMFLVGERYLFGEMGFEQDFDQAAYFFRQASTKGILKSLVREGVMHWHGMGKARNISTARDFFLEACKLGDAEACSNYAYLCSFGAPKGERNYTEALHYFRMAQEQNHSDASFNLGLMHLMGLGVSQDNFAAFRNIKIAASSGHKAALNKQAHMLFNGTGTSQNCSAAVVSWKELVDQGPLRIGLERARKSFLAKEFQQSLFQYGLMAEKGFLNAQKNAAWLSTSDFVNGQTGGNPRRAEERYYFMAAKQNDTTAMLKLANIYWEEWITVHTQETQSESQFTFECEANEVNNSCLIPSNSIESVIQKTIQLYESAANQNEGEAFVNLAFLHYHGFGFPKSYETAVSYLYKAFECGNSAFFPAMVALIGIRIDFHFHRYSNYVCQKAMDFFKLAISLFNLVTDDILLCLLSLILLLVTLVYYFQRRSSPSH